MAKGAATERTLGALHSRLAEVFTKVLEKYERSLDRINREDIEESMLEELIKNSEPSPAMLGAISKFLKDNEIGFDSEEIDKLSSTEKRLKDRRERRKQMGINLSVVPAVEEN